MNGKKNMGGRISVKPTDPNMKNALRKMALDATIARGAEVTMSDIVREIIEKHQGYQTALKVVSEEMAKAA